MGGIIESRDGRVGVIEAVRAENILRMLAARHSPFCRPGPRLLLIKI